MASSPEVQIAMSGQPETNQTPSVNPSGNEVLPTPNNDIPPTYTEATDKNVVATILFGLVSIVPIAMIVVGSLNLDKCPAERYIPIYLIVGGAFGLLQSFFNLFCGVKTRKEAGDSGEVPKRKGNPFDGIISCFLLAWFVAGSVWVYRSYLPTFHDPNAEDYCDRVTYYFAFYLITVAYVVIAMVLCFMCCCGCMALCMFKKAASPSPEPQP